MSEYARFEVYLRPDIPEDVSQIVFRKVDVFVEHELQPILLRHLGLSHGGATVPSSMRPSIP